jgi:hypothetical protein
LRSTRRGGGKREFVLYETGIARSHSLACRRVEEAVGGHVAIVADKDERHGLVIELCTTVGDGVVSTTTPDPQHVDPYRFATPDGERDASRKCSMRRPVLDKDEGEKRLCPEGFGCLGLIEQ